MLDRVSSFLGGVLGFALFAATFLGYYHAFDKHGTAHGMLSIAVPPYAWYRAVEWIWHDDFAGVDWNKRIQNDARTTILLMSAAVASDASKADELASAIETFTAKLAQYPDDKTQRIKAIVFTYLAYEDATLVDSTSEFDRELNGEGDGIIEVRLSAKTLALESQLRQYTALEDILKSRALVVATMNEKLRSTNLQSLSPRKLEFLRKTMEVLYVATKIKLERMRKIYEEVFGTFGS